MNQFEERLKEWEKVYIFLKSLDEEQIEMFIEYGKENVANFGDENNWRKLIHKWKREE